MNPYEAPKAIVADIELDERIAERPSQVVLAVRLAVAGIVLGIVALVFSWEYYASLMPNAISMVLSQAFGVLLSLWIYYKIYRGRNWARVLYLVLALSGLLFLASGAVRGQIFAGPLVTRVSTILNTGITLAVIWLLFTRPGSTWFKGSRRVTGS